MTPSPTFQIRVLGRLQVERDGIEVDVGGPKPRLLLAVLVTQMDALVTNDRLIDSLWGEEPPATAKKAVQVHVSNLRSRLGESFPLRTAQGGYILQSADIEVDAVTFEHDVKRATAILPTDPRDASEILRDAVALWAGSAYADLASESALLAEITRLTELRLRATSRRLDAELRLGHHADVVSELETLATDHPYHERFRALHMLALYRSGRQTEALRAFERTRSTLVDELGIDPSPELQELHQQILEQSAELELDDPPEHYPESRRQRGDQNAGQGHAIRGYELRERLGEGAHGIVYRAYQTSVGREIAVKVIRPEFANEPEFIRRFEAEAQFVACLEHPHIVPLYDYWRDPDGAYLAMQWMRGGSLARSVERAAWKPPAALNLLDQIGGALSYAHRQGVTHHGIKPTNVLLDEDGSAFLSDFGIAAQQVAAAGANTSSAAYLAPEKVNGESVGPAADMYSLGVLAYEMLTGDRPAAGAKPAAVANVAPGLPSALDEVIARATNPDPTERYERVDEYLHALRQAFGPDMVIIDRPATDLEIRNPFKGLRAFAETDAQDFFGRDGLVQDLVSKVANKPLTAVIGPSGSGKSSLVKAGLIPAIRRGALDTPGEVLITEMFPGSFPFEELEAALLRIAAYHPPELLADLTHDNRGLLRVSKQILPDDDSELLLVIDQFEELFTLTADDEVRRRFLDNLVMIGTDERRRVRVVITMRADFFDRPLAHAEFGTLMRAGLAPVTMPTQPELTASIEEPIRRAGLELEPGLVETIIHDVADEPGALPLLQYALTELVDGRDGRVLTSDAYKRTGGVVGALARRAEETHQSLAPSAQDAAREVFLRLVAVDENGNDTRRRVRRTELDNLGLNKSALAAVLEAYGSFRLLSFDRHPVTRGPTIEVAHEALIRTWPRYRDWVDARREDLLLRRRLEAAATDWETSAGDESFLLGGGRLDQYQQWANRSDFRLTATELNFIDASRAAADDQRESERRRIRRLRRLVAGTAVALVVALVAGGFAVVQRRRADDEATRAIDATSEAEAQALLATAAAAEAELATLISRSASVTEPDIALLLALEAHRRSPGPDTEGAILGALSTTQLSSSVQLIDHPEDLCGGDDLRLISADGLTEFNTDGEALLSKDLVSGTVTNHGTAPTPCIAWIGDEELNVGWAGAQPGRSEWFGSFQGEWGPEIDTEGWSLLVDTSVAGNRLLFASQPFVVGRKIMLTLVDASNGDIVAALPDLEVGPWRPSSHSPDGKMIAIGTVTSEQAFNGEVIVLDAETGEELHRLPMVSPAQRTAFDTVTDELIVATVSGRLLTVDLETSEITADVATTATSEFLALGIRPDGLVVAVTAGQIELVDRRIGPTGTSVSLSDVDDARVRPDGSVLAVNRFRNSAEVFELGITALVEQSWDVDPLAVVEFATGRAGIVEPGPRTAVVDLATGGRSVWDLRTSDGEPFDALALFPDEDGVTAFGGDETSVASWVDGQMVDRVELNRGIARYSFFPGRYVESVSGPGPGFAGHGALVTYSLGGSDEIFLLNTNTDQLDASFVREAHNSASAYPTGDGGVHVMDRFGRLRTYDGSGKLVGEIETALAWLTAVDGDDATGRLAFGGLSGALIVEPDTGDVDVIPDVGRVASVGFVRNGERLVIVGDDGGVRLWDVEQQLAVSLWKGSGGASPSPPWYDAATDSLWVATSGKLLRFPLDPERWVERACEVVGRELTQAEWDQFVPGDEPLRSACA